MNENAPNKDLGAAQPKLDAGETAVPAGDAEKGDDYLFYNVMPQAKSPSSIIPPSLKVTGAAQPELVSAQTVGGIPKKYLKWGVFVVIVAAVGIGIYYAYSYYLNKQAVEGNQLISDDRNTRPTPTPAPDEFSTAWLMSYFKKESCDQENLCGKEADPDLDGLTNWEEYKAETDPNNSDSDQDGIADGDEVKVFESKPMDAHTSGDQQYTDGDFLKGGYSLTRKDENMTKDELEQLSEKMRSVGLHEPTLTTLRSVFGTIYDFTPATSEPATSTSTPQSQPSIPSSIDQSPQAKQDRDSQRYNSMKNISLGLVRYDSDKKTYPLATDFKDMASMIRPYVRVAVKFNDPIDIEPYVYKYEVNNNGADFTLSYYSETQNQVIKLHANDALKFKADDEAQVFDDQRKMDLDMIRGALLVYSNATLNPQMDQDYIFPTKTKYKTALVPTYLSSIPKDPKTQQDYEYTVSAKLDSFTIKAVLSNPAPGTTGWLCDQDECKAY